MSVYIHIPFCMSICAYCDFHKMLKNEKWINNYLNELEKEIKKNYKNEKIKTLYIGGGTPSSLNIKQLEKLFEIIKIFKLEKHAEITMEANSEDLTDEKLKLLKNLQEFAFVAVRGCIGPGNVDLNMILKGSLFQETPNWGFPRSPSTKTRGKLHLFPQTLNIRQCCHRYTSPK